MTCKNDGKTRLTQLAHSWTTKTWESQQFDNAWSS